MKIEILIKRKLVTAAICAALGLNCWMETPAYAQAVPALPPGVQDVVKLTKAGIGEDVILSQVKNNAATYSLNTDQIIYLSQSGVSQNVIKALLTPQAAAPVATAPPAMLPPTMTPPPPPQAPTTVPAVAAPPPNPDTAPPATYDGFHAQLAPFGSWIEIPGYGSCWRPSVAQLDPAWRPYADSGHWMYTDNGWYWQSDYPWGTVAFHYGRWLRDSLGWYWVPGYDWAPSWVCWRHSDGYLGWAPLPPAAVFRAGVGLEFNGRLALDLDFGLDAGAFVFVGYDHFWDHGLRPFFLGRDRADFFFHNSVVMNGYRVDHGRFIVEGFGRDRIGLWTRHDVRVEAPYHDGRFIRHEEERRAVRHDRFP